MLKRFTTTCVVLFASGLGACAGSVSVPPANASLPATDAMEADSWVVGKVVDRESGNAIPKVSLTLYFQLVEQTPRSPERSKSDKAGNFSFGPMTAGPYCVLASSLGFHSVAREFTVQRGKRDTVDIVLDRQNPRVSVQRCMPNRASIDLCPEEKQNVRERTRCSGQP